MSTTKRLRESPYDRIKRMREIIHVLSTRITAQEVLIVDAKKREEEAWETSQRMLKKLRRHGISPFDEPTWLRWVRGIKGFFVRQ
jgi:hypothetical protein